MILKRYTNLSVNMKLLMGGALVHILFEFSGANELWCRTTYNKFTGGQPSKHYLSKVNVRDFLR